MFEKFTKELRKFFGKVTDVSTCIFTRKPYVRTLACAGKEARAGDLAGASVPGEAEVAGGQPGGMALGGKDAVGAATGLPPAVG